MSLDQNSPNMDFEVVGQITKIETIAVGHGIRELQNLKRLFGDAHWRKLKGEVRIKLSSGHVRLAEIYIGMKPTELGVGN